MILCVLFFLGVLGGKVFQFPRKRYTTRAYTRLESGAPLCYTRRVNGNLAVKRVSFFRKQAVIPRVQDYSIARRSRAFLRWRLAAALRLESSNKRLSAV